MKRLLAFIFALIVMFSFCGCDFDGMCYFYTDNVIVDNLNICINDKTNCCLAGWYECNGYTEEMEITIPDEYDNKPVKRIGGYVGRGVPVPFCINMSNMYNSSDEAYYFVETTVDEAKCTVVDLPFVLNLGKNIDTIVYVENRYYPNIEQDGSVVYYHPVVSINCSEENETFCSENGRLYNKKTQELIEDFDYAD